MTGFMDKETLITREEIAALTEANAKVASNLANVVMLLTQISEKMDKNIDQCAEASNSILKVPELVLKVDRGLEGITYLRWVQSAIGSVVGVIGIKFLLQWISGKP